jgi:predicted NUDIX family phosphoesterase
MHSGATGKKEVLRLTTRLRELEEKLGLQRRKRQRKAV